MNKSKLSDRKYVLARRTGMGKLTLQMITLSALSECPMLCLEIEPYKQDHGTLLFTIDLCDTMLSIEAKVGIFQN